MSDIYQPDPPDTVWLGDRFEPIAPEAEIA